MELLLQELTTHSAHRLVNHTNTPLKEGILSGVSKLQTA